MKQSINSTTKKIFKTQQLKTRNIFEPEIYDSYTDKNHIDPIKLQQAKIGVQGVGGIGSYNLQHLSRTGVGYVEFCDGDKVELKNLPTQLFYKNQVGQNKAISCLESLKKETTGETTLVAYPYDFKDSIKQYPEAFSTISLLISCVDNHKARYEAAEFGYANKIPVIIAGVSKNMNIYSLFIQTPGNACFNCFKNQYNNKNKSQRNQCRHLAVLSPHTGAVSLILHTTIELIMGRMLPWNFYYFSFDGKSLADFLEIKDDCELCGGT